MDPITILITGVIAGALTSALAKPVAQLGKTIGSLTYYQFKIRKYRKRLDTSIKELNYLSFDKYLSKIKILDEDYKKSNINKIKSKYNIRDNDILNNEKSFITFFIPNRYIKYLIDKNDSDIEDLVEGSVMRAFENYNPPFINEEDLTDIED